VPEFFGYLKQRLPLLSAACVCGVGLTLAGSRPDTQDVQGLAKLLDESFHLTPERLVWEPSRGLGFDFLLGRPLLFEARDQQNAASGPRDIFRVLVRLSPEGKVLDLGEPHNLTNTSKSDEHQLDGNHSYAAWITEAALGPPSISILRFGPRSGDPAAGWLDHLQLGVTAWLDTGTFKGLDRIDIIGPTAQSDLSLLLGEQELRLVTAQGNQHAEQSVPSNQWAHAETIAAHASLSSGVGARWVNRDRKAIPWSHFFANTLRRQWGTTFVARLESTLFSARDGVLRTSYDLGHLATDEPAPPAPSPAPSPAHPNWPPARLSSGSSSPADGTWQAWTSRLVSAEGEPLFYRTLLHPDPKRPYAELHLVAFDMRRLELGVRAGYEDPEPETGPPGSGHVPLEIAPEIVATFNGAFKSTHGGYGMKAEGRVLRSPVVGAATVRVDAGGRVGLGTWQASDQASSYVELRQNLDPLLDQGAVNPRGRTTWGEHVDATGVAIERSALCLHESGHLLYAWATEATGHSLAEGLRQAGCRFAMHLDMNPGHCTFALNKIESVDPLRAAGELLDPRMKANETRYVRWSPKDFFYLAKRRPGSVPLERTLEKSARAAFQPDPGRQPAPSSIPGVFSWTKKLGPLSLSILRIDPERVKYQLLQGSAEGLPPSAPLPELDEKTHPLALVALGLGHQTYGSRPGLSVDRQVVVPHARSYATLLLRGDQQLQILAPGEPPPEEPGTIAVQLPALARDAALLDAAKELGGRRARHALCMDASGALYFGQLEHDTVAPLVQSLLDLGCNLVLEADRGSHSPTYVARAQTETLPQTGLVQTVLYALDREMQPYTYHF